MVIAAKNVSAGDITVRTTLDLLDTDFREVAEGVAKGKYALWLGSGISRERVDDLRIVVRRVLDHLSEKARAEEGDDRPFTTALIEALRCALTKAEVEQINIDDDPAQWPNVENIIDRLIGNYAQLLDVRIPGKAADYLVWEVVDVRETYANDNLEPDCEHKAIALLALEGVFPKIASANWDGLVEKAVAQITNGADLMAVLVRADEINGASGRSFIHKFHGCAVRARADEARYREYIVGRKEQITNWPHDEKFKLMKNQLEGLSVSYATLMIGLSAQDSNIQDIFSAGREMFKKPWPSTPPAYVFAGDELGADQGTMLKSVYQDGYDANQAAIKQASKIPAYGKPLLSALVLSVLGQKCAALIGLANAPNLPPPEREKVISGAMSLRNEVASRAGATSTEIRLFMDGFIAGMTRALALFRGDVHNLTKRVYGAVSGVPLGQISQDPNLPISAMPELAVLIGVAGLGKASDGWVITEPNGSPEQGTLSIQSPAMVTPRKLFVVSNSETVSKLIGEGVVDEYDEHTLVAVCSAPVARRQTHPLGVFGRSGAAPVLREFSFREILSEAQSADHMLIRLKEEATL